MKFLNALNAIVLAAILLVGVSLSMPATCAVEEPADAEPPKPPDPRIVEVPAMGFTVPARVVEVYDGDTLTAEVKFVMRVRLLDCWAPEIKGPDRLKGFAARDNLKKLAEGKTGVLHIPLTSENIGDATSMGRILGKMIINGDDLSYEQVKAKHATKTKPKEAKE